MAVRARVETGSAAGAVRLRWPRRSDAARMAAYLNDYEIARMVSRVPHPYTLEHAHDWIDGQPEQRAAGTDFVFCIALRGAGMVGAIGLHQRDGDTFELGYWLAKDFWGRGVATQAGKLAIAWAQRNLHVTRLKADHFADNPASGRVLEKLGFAYTGVKELKPCLARGTPVLSLAMRWIAPEPTL
jgi:RimJ/RimL family protein N-acetyltransferase